MAQTLGTTFHGQIIAGTFAHRDNAEDAIAAFREFGVFPSDIQVLPLEHDPLGKDVYSEILTERGFSQPQAFYYDQMIHEGKTLVAIHGVTDPATIIDIFNKFDAGFNPDGSRNVRDDVVGLTAGAVTGAVAGGIAGAVSGGPLGGAVGAAAGEVVGGIAGAALGKAAEHKK
jgi:hypothetical protein